MEKFQPAKLKIFINKIYPTDCLLGDIYKNKMDFTIISRFNEIFLKDISDFKILIL